MEIKRLVQVNRVINEESDSNSNSLSNNSSTYQSNNEAI